MTAGSDVAVVGGGVIGLSAAWRVAEAGLSVTVVDPRPGRGASWAAAGMLAPVTEAHYGEEALLELTLASAERYPAFVERLQDATGHDVGYRRSGTVLVARDLDDNAALDDLFTFQQKLGLGVERLRARDVRQVEPGLAPGVRGGILVPDDHQIDNRALVEALAAACDRAGVETVLQRAEQLLVTGDRAAGVRLDRGNTVEAARVVLAAGCWSRRLDGVPQGALPDVRPVKGQLLHLRGGSDPLLVSHNLRGLEVYLVPRLDGRLVVGATVEEQGYDTRATAGGVFDLLRAAYELVPGITELELVEVATGLRPGSPDNAPLVGETALDGLVVATGHHRNGVLLAPVTADGIATLLTTGSVPRELAPFRPDRFGGRAP